jgi:hypothetical protein
VCKIFIVVGFLQANNKNLKKEYDTIMDEQTLTMVFTLDNGDTHNINVDMPRENLTKANTDQVMQNIIDQQALVEDGHKAVAIKEAYIVTETKNVLA